MLCGNAEHDACNWLIDAGDTTGYCRACRHNGTVPDLSDPAQLAGWRELEMAKHRLFYSLIRWKLPLKTRQRQSRARPDLQFPRRRSEQRAEGHDRP